MARHLLANFSWGILTAAMVAGCDSASHDADRQIQTNVHEAALVAEPERTQKLESVAALSDASSAAKSQAAGHLAQAHLDAANALMHKIARSDLEVAGLIWRINQLVGQINNTNTLSSGYLLLDPAAAGEEITKKIAEARGSGETAWFTHGGATIPTLAGVTQEISRLDGEIAKLEEQSKQLATQRAGVLDESEQANQQAQTLEGKPGVDEYKRASDLRKQAADLSIEIDKVEAALLPLRNQLAVAQGQRDILNQVIAQYEQQQQQLAEGWAAMQQQAQAQNQIAQGIAAGGAATTQPSDSATLSALIEQLDVAQQNNAELRFAAEGRLNEAIKAFADAASEAGNISGEIRQLQADGLAKDSARLVSLTTLREVLNPAMFTLQQANAQYLLATVHSARAAMLAERNRLNQAVTAATEQASLSIPETVNNAELEAQINESRALSDTAYQEAENLLVKALEAGGSDEQKIAVKIARILNLYGWSQAAAAFGDTEAAQTRLNDAIAAKQQAEQEGIALPILPAALGASAGPSSGDEVETAGAVSAADQFADALSKGDAQTAKSLVAEDQAATVDTLIAATGAYNTLLDAVKAKFPDVSADALAGAPDLSAIIRDGDVAEQDDSAELTHAALPQPLTLRRADGQWKLDLTTLDPTVMQAMQVLAQIAPQLAQDIAAGKYARVEDLRSAVLTALSAPR